jgi:hypothetical protein
MRKGLPKHPLRWRVIALVAAYAVALSSLIASVGAARAAAESAAQPSGTLCHTNVGGRTGPESDQDKNRICADRCCVGCLTLIAAEPSFQGSGVALPKPSSQTIAPRATVVVGGSPSAKSHQSRAPPS